MKPTAKNKRPVVTLKHYTYQPSKAELEADVRVKATFEEAVSAMAKTVEVRHERKNLK